ncbi:hypothetical protein [Frankia sp. AvcI1]|uniref:hypothetical protein n=1 Tax=Frankia sp. AvcI1 TaxID=573496 RepID=UPI0006EC1330|nr:hypothetical protein [Frankia sp. AvcI1]
MRGGHGPQDGEGAGDGATPERSSASSDRARPATRRPGRAGEAADSGTPRSPNEDRCLLSVGGPQLADDHDPAGGTQRLGCTLGEQPVGEDRHDGGLAVVPVLGPPVEPWDADDGEADGGSAALVGDASVGQPAAQRRGTHRTSPKIIRSV